MFLFLIIQSLFTFLPLLFFFIYKRKRKEKIVRVILFYIIYCIFQDVANYFFSSVPSLRSNVIYLFALYTIVEFSLFCLFYYYLFPDKHVIRKITKIAWASFLIFAILDFFLINQFKNFDSFTIGVESLILILLCGYYLYYQVTTTLSMFVYRTFNFWIIVTFLMYISSTFFLYLMTDTMGEDHEFQKYYLFINFGANILKNILLCFAISRKNVLSPDNNLEKKKEFNIDLGDNIVLQQNLKL